MQPSMIGKESHTTPSYSFLNLVLPFLVLAFGVGVLGGCVSSEKYEAEKARSLNFQRLLAQEEKRTGELNVKYQEAQRKSSELESQNRDLNTEMTALQEQLDRAQSELTRSRDGGGMVDPSSGDDLTLDDPSISEFGLDDLDFKDSDFGDLDGDLGGGTGGEAMGAAAMGGAAGAAMGDDLGSDGGGDLGGDLGEDFGADLDSDLGGDMGGDLGGDLGSDLGGEMGNDLALESEPNMANGTPTYHTVSRGETLFSISRQYGVSVRDVKNWNNLNSDLITVGQSLIVSSP